jgi:hypothetical protein
VNALFASLVLSFTVLLAVCFGVLAAYSLVSTILYAFAHQSRPQLQPQPVLLPRNVQAGAD